MSYEDRKAQADALKTKLHNLFMSSSLLQCEECAIVNPTTDKKYCKDCFLIEMGLIDSPPFITTSYSENPEEYAKQKKMVDDIKQKNLLIGSLVSHSNCMLRSACSLLLEERNDNEKLKNANKCIIEESTKLYEEKQIVDDKFKKLGRPSAFSKRYDLYCKHYLGVSNPPSYNQLAKIVGVSRQQVIRDLKRMGQYHKKLDKQ